MRTLRSLLLSGSALALLLISVGLVARGIGASRWRDVTAHFRAQEAAWDAHDFSRPSVFGRTEAGNALPLLLEAFEKTSALTRENDHPLGAWEKALFADPSRDPVAEDPRWEEALALLHRAALQREARVEFSWSEGAAVLTPRLLDARRLACAALRHAEHLAPRSGEAAADLVLDVLSMGRDLASSSPQVIHDAIGASVIGIAYDALTREEDPIEPDPAGWRRLSSGLARLEPSLTPQSHALGSDLLLLAREIERALDQDAASMPELFDADPSSFASRLARGLSERWYCADQFRDFDEQQRRVLAASDGPWSEARTALERARLHDEGGLAQRTLTIDRSVLETRRRAVAQLRLLRGLCAVQLGEPLPELADPFGPFGDRLRSSTTAEGVRIWSAGPDGVAGSGDAGAGADDLSLTIAHG